LQKIKAIACRACPVVHMNPETVTTSAGNWTSKTETFVPNPCSAVHGSVVGKASSIIAYNLKYFL
jgi:hypothetical protein